MLWKQTWGKDGHAKERSRADLLKSKNPIQKPESSVKHLLVFAVLGYIQQSCSLNQPGTLHMYWTTTAMLTGYNKSTSSACLEVTQLRKVPAVRVVFSGQCCAPLSSLHWCCGLLFLVLLPFSWPNIPFRFLLYETEEARQPWLSFLLERRTNPSQKLKIVSDTHTPPHPPPVLIFKTRNNSHVVKLQWVAEAGNKS